MTYKSAKLKSPFMSYESDPVIGKICGALLPLDISDDTDKVRRDGQRRAAVLMSLVMRDEWQVILTQRPETMPHHPGQISFPGGKVEKDETARQATLREVEEEIGVKASAITLIGRLPSFDAVSDFRVTPFIGPLATQRRAPTPVASARGDSVRKMFCSARLCVTAPFQRSTWLLGSVSQNW